jgi:hypothetical protein
VVVVSADATSAAIEVPMRAVASGYLTKRPDVKEFLDTLERFVGAARSR